MMIAFFRLYTENQLSWPILKVELNSWPFQIQHGQGSYKIWLILFICALRPKKLPLLPQRWVFALSPFTQVGHLLLQINLSNASSSPLSCSCSPRERSARAAPSPSHTKHYGIPTIFPNPCLLSWSEVTKDFKSFWTLSRKIFLTNLNLTLNLRVFL